jgi:hypothetical protein
LASCSIFETKRSSGELYFPDVYYRFKFCVFVAGGSARHFPHALCGFQLLDLSEIDDPDRTVPLKSRDFSNVNPNTGTAPIFRHRRDAQITAGIHERTPVLVDRRHKPPRIVWPLRYATMFHMANDSAAFKTRKQLENEGYYPVTRNRLKKGELEYLPLYEGKMVQAFDHRAADIVLAGDNLFRPGQTDVVSAAEHADPDFLPNPRYFVDRSVCQWPVDLEWILAFKDITSVTNSRTMIAALIPHCGAGHTLPIFFPASQENDDAIDDAVAQYRRFAPALTANMNSFIFDYLARQKVQGNHLTWFILEQLPLLPAKAYERKFRGVSSIEAISREVLHLTYTANDMAQFARDMGHDGSPFRWDEEDRRHRRARLDAIYFHLYGVGKGDAAYILDTFPIVKREDEEAFGRYLTKELILAYMNAVAAGDIDTIVSI